MNSQTLEIKRTLDGFVAPGEKVIFNEQSISTPGVSYNSTTGEITFNEIGAYSVRWWVATETTPKGAIEFALTSSQGEFILGSSPQKTGQVSGFGALDVLTEGTTLSLVNTTATNNVFSIEVVLKAYLLILPIANTGPTGPQGDIGPTGPQGNIGPMGPQGNIGPTGPQGNIGPMGPQGNIGPTGPQGNIGPIGPQGDIGADGRSAYQVAVDSGYVGTEEEWLASLVGSTGPQGDIGPTGPQGDTGADGRSAYQVAVEGGYIGTEEEWLASLVGPTGPQGDTGPIGPTEIWGIEVGLINNQEGIIANDDPVIFDTVLNQLGSAISYDNTIGEFTISQNGYYLVNWWVSTDGADMATGTSFSLNVNGITHSTGASPNVTGHVTGFALIAIDAVPITITLTNVSGGRISFEDTHAQASLVIMAIPESE